MIRSAGLVASAVLISVWACSPRGQPNTGASLVELRRDGPGNDFRAVGKVSCRYADGRSRADNVERCQADLLNSGQAFDADVVVIERETAGWDACAACVEMTGTAYRRELPWERTAPARVRTRAANEPARLATGTGFVVATDGTILTAHHVVEGARTIVVTLPDGNQVVAVTPRRLASSDLAVLKVTARTPGYLSLGDSALVEVGQRVWTYGFPVVTLLGLEPKFSDGAVSSLSGVEGASEVFQVTVAIQPGNSGGPLLTEDGRVVGVITSTAAAIPFFRATGSLPQGVNWAVKADPAKQLFDAPAALPPATSRTEAVARARGAVCFIEAVHGDGLLGAPPGFGDGITATHEDPPAFSRSRARCQEGDAEACLAAARTVIVECTASAADACRHRRWARTLLLHACAVGRRPACDALGPPT